MWRRGSLPRSESAWGARAQMRRLVNLECLGTCLDALHIDSRLMLGGPMDQRAKYERQRNSWTFYTVIQGWRGVDQMLINFASLYLSWTCGVPKWTNMSYLCTCRERSCLPWQPARGWVGQTWSKLPSLDILRWANPILANIPDEAGVRHRLNCMDKHLETIPVERVIRT